MRRRLTPLLLLGLLAWLVPPEAWADDDAIFTQQQVAPNVMILIDTSGSMDNTINGVKKLTSAKTVVKNLLNAVTGVRFGIFRFNDTEDGGTLVAECGSSVSAMITAVDALTADGYTPLGRATQNVQDYFEGNWTTIERVCTGSGKKQKCTDQTVTVPSPIQYECQKNYTIIVTDGLPNGEPEELVADTAAAMFDSDHSNSFAGKQNVIVHTVGFDIPAGAALLQLAATNGGGNFYEVANQAQLQQALLDAVSAIVQDAYSYTAPLIPAGTVSGGANAYLASFEPDSVAPFWPGYLTAYDRDANGRVPVDGEGHPDPSAKVWEAGALLAARAASTRTIQTVVSGALSPFTTANATVTQAMLSVTSTTARTKLIEFVRGVDAYDHDRDGSTTDERPWKLGDIYHSTPVLVFPPPLNSTDSDYQDFKTTNAGRETIVLVGANDGMMHAFRAGDGYELWAVIPPDMLSTLKSMSATVGTHSYYADSSPVVADVKLGGTWKTIAVFGARRGAKKYYALDITNTSNPSWLWSFGDAELGETWSEPLIGKIRLSGGVDKWVAFVGGGYDTASNNGSGRAFYVIDLSNGQTLWKYGPGGSSDAANMQFSIAASPNAVDLDGDGYVDRVYVGDVGGQLWKFDVSAVGTLSSGLVTNWTGKRLFVADPTQTVPPPAGPYLPEQAMYGAPALSFDGYGDLWVFLGTGDRNVPKSVSNNRFYAIKDNTTMANGSALDEDDLVEATSGDEVTQGWYLELEDDEKVLAGATVFNGVVYFSTYLPLTTNVCEATDGIARLYAMNMVTGLAGIDFDNGHKLEEPTDSDPLFLEVGGGVPSQPVISVGATEDSVVVATTDQEITEIAMPAATTKRVRYWREVF